MRKILMVAALASVGCSSVMSSGPIDGAAGAMAGSGGGGSGGTGSGGSGGSGGTAGNAGGSGGSAGGGAGGGAGADASVPVDTSTPPPADAMVPTGDGLPAGTFTARPLGSTKAARGFHEYLPPGYGDGVKRPLIVFVHGLGENGNGTSELPRVLNNGIAKVIGNHQWPASRPFVVLSPQHPPTPVSSGFDCTTPTELHDFISFALANYEVDPHRVYLAGLSCGSIGSWNYLGQYLDEQVAAAVLVAGDGRAAWTAQGCKLSRVGIWAFHGTLDGTVPPVGSTEPLAKLMDCPQPRKDQRLTTYPGVGHESWVQTYEQADSPNDIYGWLLGMSR
jgi:predicted esterase